MKLIVALLACLFLASSASAQIVTGYTCVVRTGPVPVVTIPLALAAVVCNQPQPVVVGTDNPTKLSWDDPAFPKAPDPAARACLVDTAAAATLNALPFGPTGYNATCTADTATGSSPAPIPSNTFTHPGIQPPALTGIKVYR